jgi:hypothetical protein
MDLEVLKKHHHNYVEAYARNADIPRFALVNRENDKVLLYPSSCKDYINDYILHVKYGTLPVDYEIFGYYPAEQDKTNTVDLYMVNTRTDYNYAKRLDNIKSLLNHFNFPDYTIEPLEDGSLKINFDNFMKAPVAMASLFCLLLRVGLEFEGDLNSFLDKALDISKSLTKKAIVPKKVYKQLDSIKKFLKNYPDLPIKEYKEYKSINAICDYHDCSGIQSYVQNYFKPKK